MTYQPGSHLIASLQTEDVTKIAEYTAFKNWLHDRIHDYNLTKLGEVWHNFSPGGFTGVVCLSESHLSIHTWPEHLLINLDIYLSNYERRNDNTVNALFQEISHFFNGQTVQVQTIVR
jgi:S-adenosylmethionine decarboxylase